MILGDYVEGIIPECEWWENLISNLIMFRHHNEEIAAVTAQQ